MYNLSIVIIIINIILLYNIYYLYKPSIEPFISNIPLPNNIWLYWENKPNSLKPVYLELCFETIKKHNMNNFNIHLLNQNTVYHFLPTMRRDLDKYLTIPQKADYIRLLLLQKYGGIWLDSDIIVIRNLYPILQKLKDYDYVGFGCHSKKCHINTSGYPKPANWVMVSRKNGKLVTKCLDIANNMLDTKPNIFSKQYHALGRNLLWNCIDILLKKDKYWNYYHYDSKCIERDSNGNKLINKRSLSNEDIDQKCIDKYLFIPIYNTAPGFPKWFRMMDRNSLLNSSMLISKLFRNSLSTSSTSSI